VTFEDRVSAVAGYGFTPRQAAFLTMVMLHSGVCMPRHYTKFAGITFGHNTRINRSDRSTPLRPSAPRLRRATLLRGLSCLAEGGQPGAQRAALTGAARQARARPSPHRDARTHAPLSERRDGCDDRLIRATRGQPRKANLALTIHDEQRRRSIRAALCAARGLLDRTEGGQERPPA
jgi:hypothetical protein